MIMNKLRGIRRITFDFLLIGGILWSCLSLGNADTKYQNNANNSNLHHPLLGNDTLIYSSRNSLPTVNTTNTSISRLRRSQELLCNGLQNLCDKPLNSILFAAPHNSNAALINGYKILPNSFRSLEAALQSGYRSIQIDMAKCRRPLGGGEKIQLIHGYCALDKRDPRIVLNNIYNFVERNRNEVILLVIEIVYDQNIQFPLSEIDTIFQSIPGFKDRMYSHPDRLNPMTTNRNAWPTLRQLIDLNQRIIVFTYNGESCYKNPSTCPSGFHDWFMYAGETEYSFINIDQISTIEYSCNITRGQNGRKDFFGINNFLKLPVYNQNAKILNTESFLNERIQNCSKYNGGLDANFLLVNFWDTGDVLQVVQEYNAAL